MLEKLWQKRGQMDTQTQYQKEKKQGALFVLITFTLFFFFHNLSMIDHYPIPNNDILSLTLVISPEGQEVFSSTLAGQL